MIKMRIKNIYAILVSALRRSDEPTSEDGRFSLHILFNENLFKSLDVKGILIRILW